MLSSVVKWIESADRDCNLYSCIVKLVHLPPELH